MSNSYLIAFAITDFTCLVVDSMNSVLKSKGRDISEESEEEPEVLENNFLARGESVNAMEAMFCHYTTTLSKKRILCLLGSYNELKRSGQVSTGDDYIVVFVSRVALANWEWWLSQFTKEKDLGTRLLYSETINRPFPCCCEPHYESEAKRKAFHMKISFVCI